MKKTLTAEQARAAAKYLKNLTDCRATVEHVAYHGKLVRCSRKAVDGTRRCRQHTPA